MTETVESMNISSDNMMSIVTNLTETFEFTNATCGLVGIGLGAGVSLFLWLVLPIVLCCFGFTSAGPGYNTCASGWQSSIGDVQAGSCFSCLQMIAMTPICAVWKLLPGILIGIAAGIGSYYACNAAWKEN